MEGGGSDSQAAPARGQALAKLLVLYSSPCPHSPLGIRLHNEKVQAPPRRCFVPGPRGVTGAGPGPLSAGRVPSGRTDRQLWRNNRGKEDTLSLCLCVSVSLCLSSGSWSLTPVPPGQPCPSFWVCAVIDPLPLPRLPLPLPPPPSSLPRFQFTPWPAAHAAICSQPLRGARPAGRWRWLQSCWKLGPGSADSEPPTEVPGCAKHRPWAPGRDPAGASTAPSPSDAAPPSP